MKTDMDRTYGVTPLLQSRKGLDNVWFKMDCWQPSGSFKLRGMDALLRFHAGQGRRDFVASSGGNAGFSLAFAARRLGCAVTVVVPGSTPARMRDMIAAEGAELRVHGAVWNEADGLARTLAEETGAVYVSPFDDPLLWQGHSSLVDEVVAESAALGRAFPEELVVAVGGGGLLCGVMEGLERHGLLDKVSVVAAETHGAASYALALERGGVAALDRIDTVATSLGAKAVAEAAFQWSRRGNIRSLLVSDAEALAACEAFRQDFGSHVEAACGAALCQVYGPRPVERETLVVVCGGLLWS